jgi:hypothetical protein
VGARARGRWSAGPLGASAVRASDRATRRALRCHGARDATPPGSPRRAEVRAWVSTLEVQSHGTPPDKWLAEVTAALATGPVTWRVPPRSRARTAARRVNHWSAGITDAEERYGLISHPDAPIFNWPPLHDPTASPLGPGALAVRQLGGGGR